MTGYYCISLILKYVIKVILVSEFQVSISNKIFKVNTMVLYPLTYEFLR